MDNPKNTCAENNVCWIHTVSVPHGVYFSFPTGAYRGLLFSCTNTHLVFKETRVTGTQFVTASWIIRCSMKHNDTGRSVNPLREYKCVSICVSGVCFFFHPLIHSRGKDIHSSFTPNDLDKSTEPVMIQIGPRCVQF